MGKKSRIKKEKLLQEQTLARASKNLKPQRTFLRKSLIGLVSLALIAYLGVKINNYFSSNKVTYEQALKDETKREQWARDLIDKKDIPDYATISYADKREFKELREKYNLQVAPAEDTFAVSIIRDEKNISHGAKTDIYLSPGCFLDIYKKVPEIWKDLDLIIRNVVKEHELLHARDFNHGIENYPLTNFYDSNSNLDKRVFLAISELNGYKKEIDALKNKQHQSTSPLFSQYIQNLPQLIKPYYNVLTNQQFTKNLDSNFVSRLKNDLKINNY